LIRYFWQAIAAVYPKMGLPVLPGADAVAAMREAPCPPWPEIAAAACASDDEHDHSLAFSAWQEEAAYGDPLYRRVAARRVGLIAGGPGRGDCAMPGGTTGGGSMCGSPTAASRRSSRRAAAGRRTKPRSTSPAVCSAPPSSTAISISTRRWSASTG